MTADDLVRLQTPEAQALLHQYAAAEPEPLALQLHRTHPHLAAAVATQIALRQQAAHKLPEWVSAGCLFTRPLLEQATPSTIQPLRQQHTGFTAVDLSAGLGADTLWLSRCFAHVTAVEIDPLRADLLRHNLRQLGATNVRVETAAAHEWLAQHTGNRPEIVFLDPARRSEHRHKTVALADCTPDVTQLWHIFQSWQCRVALKLSPLFDVAEALRLPSVTTVSVHSLEGEVKEVFTRHDCNGTDSKPTLRAAGVWHQTHWQIHEQPCERLPVQGPQPYLLLPDAAIEKAGLIVSFCAQYDIRGAAFTHTSGYLTAASIPATHLPARVLAIEHQLPYKPKTLRKTLTELGYGKAVIHRRQFPLSVATARAELGIEEGVPVTGETYPRYICLTETTNGKTALLCKRIR